jgi:hypothetical protein
MMDGVAAGFTEFMGRRKEKRSRTVPKEDMFI